MRTASVFVILLACADIWGAASAKASDASAEKLALSLRDTVDRALARDALVRDAQQALESAQATLVEAKAYTPTLSLSSSTYSSRSGSLDPQSAITGTQSSSLSYGSSIGVPMGGGVKFGLSTSAGTSTTNSELRAGGGRSTTFSSASMAASLSRPLPLFRNERVLTSGERRAAEIALRQAELAFAEARRQVVGDALTRFFAALRAQRQVEIAAASQQDAGELLRIAHEKLKQGKVAEIDVMEAQVSADSARTAALQAQSAAATALDDLKNFLGLPLEQNVQVLHEAAAEPSLTPLNEANLIERALKQRTDLRQLALAIRSADLSLRQVEANSRPGVFLTSGYGRSAQAPTIGESFSNLVNPSWFVGLSTSMNLTGKESRAEIQQARGSLRLSRLDEQLQKDQVRVEIRRLVREVENAAASAGLLAGTVKRAEENLRIRQTQFDHGLVRPIDVMQTEHQLVQTRTQYSDALIDYQLATTRLSLAIGEMPKFGGPGE
jgi:outer membrane protein TolC